MARPLGLALPLIIKEVQAHEGEIMDAKAKQNAKSFFMLQNYYFFLIRANILNEFFYYANLRI
jgi:hypothetical protein